MPATYESHPAPLGPSYVAAFEATAAIPDSELALAHQAGSAIASERIIERHLGKLIVEARRIWRRLPVEHMLDVEDITQDLALELVAAADRYEPEKATGQDSLLVMMKHGPYRRVEINARRFFGVRPSQIANQLLVQLHMLNLETHHSENRLPTNQEISQRLGIPVFAHHSGRISVQDIQHIPHLTTGMRGFGIIYDSANIKDVPLRELHTQWNLQSAMVRDQPSNPEDITVRADIRRQVRACIKTLQRYGEKHEAQVLIMRYGIDSDIPMTFKEIGDILGLPDYTVARIERRARQQVGQWLSDMDLATDPSA